MYARCGISLDHGRQAGTTQIKASHLMPLMHATQQQAPSSVDILLRDRPCDIQSTPNENFNIALSIAIASTNIARVKQLPYHSQVGLSSSIKSSVVAALEYQRHDILRLLLDDSQVDANAKDSKGYTPLHLAVIYDDPVAVRILLEHPRVEVNCLTAAGDSALVLAAKTFDGNRARSQILHDIVSMPDVLLDQRDRMGRSALWHAVNTSNILLIMMLYQDPRTEVGMADREGITPYV
ncbi:ankyrin repeat protein [Penicillium malachiteum]|uniref:ankyrin repeat protein n=1 Tax=Penicillium malachiteum TaxID=1324776 RepID=UPI0025480062|nr:ankyrin repeat protein [Penicillium malachiteum]KAJ5737313.1 ankyrin repeat protein [Penicillium malachiteum]